MGVLIYAFGYPGIVSFPRKLRYRCLVAWEKHVALHVNDTLINAVPT